MGACTVHVSRALHARIACKGGLCAHDTCSGESLAAIEMQPELKRAPEMFADGVDGERISHFGDRFAYYAKRVRTLTLDQDYCSDSGDINEIFDQDFDEDHLPDPDHYVVHPTVLLAWGRHYHLFPRLRELAVFGHPSLDAARDEQVSGRFIRSPHLISLIIKWGKGLSKL
jgi:hypothetical protein